MWGSRQPSWAWPKPSPIYIHANSLSVYIIRSKRRVRRTVSQRPLISFISHRRHKSLCRSLSLSSSLPFYLCLLLYPTRIFYVSFDNINDIIHFIIIMQYGLSLALEWLLVHFIRYFVKRVSSAETKVVLYNNVFLSVFNFSVSPHPSLPLSRCIILDEVWLNRFMICNIFILYITLQSDKEMF